MEQIQILKCEPDTRLKERPRSAYHQYLLSSILPEAEKEFSHIRNENKVLKKENELLRMKLEALVTATDQFKAEKQRVHRVSKTRDQQKSELIHCRSELVVLVEKIKILETELRRRNKENEDLKEELESTKKKLQSVKKDAVNQRAEQQNLKEQLDQVIKDRDGIRDTWQRCKTECSELRNKISNQQSSLTIKDSKCSEQVKRIHLLEEEKERLEKELSIQKNDAAQQRRALDKCEEKLHDSRTCLLLQQKMGRRIVINRHNPHPPLLGKPTQQVPLQKIQSLQNELVTETEERRKAEEQCVELKRSLTQISVQFQQCQGTVRHQREKLQAVTAQRNMYQSEAEKLGLELADIKKRHCDEKVQSKMAKRNTIKKLSFGEKSSKTELPPLVSRTPPKTGKKLQSTPLPPISSEVLPELRITGKKFNCSLGRS